MTDRGTTTGRDTTSTQLDIDADTVQAWAELSGDFNRLHVDPEFAATTPYGRCIAHGPILASIVGELLAAELGPTLWASAQTAFRFVGPVFVPSRITATVSIEPGRTGSAGAVCVDESGATVLTVKSTWTDPES